MVLARLSLTNFRNIARLELTLSPGLNILIGDNAQGKTNILEAVHYLSTTRSFRGSRDLDLVSFGENFARLSGGEVEAVLQAGLKTLKLRGKPARAAEVLGALRSVLFSPQEMSLLAGPPQDRRDHLDELISRIDRKYLLTLIAYHKSLKQRNKLLWQIREGRAREEEISSWDSLLVRDGAAIILRRQEIVAKLQAELGQISPGLLPGGGLKLGYLGKLVGEGSLVTAFQQALSISRPREIAVATTLTGPHRDDWEMVVKERHLGRFGSRGEQRAAILSLKLAEVSLNESQTGERPILLLDDVLSELDPAHQARLLAEVGKQQTILSTTSLELFPKEILSGAKVFRVSAGKVTEDQ